jgi:mono/diheme cytochrome c family protein
MARTILNSVLMVATIALLALNWLLSPDTGRRNYEVLPGMATSVPYDAFSANPSFADGKTLREPVPGTIIRGYMPLHYTASKEDAERAGRELTSPFSGNRQALARGAEVYASQCQSCHGPAGKGDGVVAQRGFPAPPSLLADRAMKMADGQMFHVLTWGQGNMPSYASHIDRDDRWKAIEHVRKLQGKRP